MSYYTRFVKTTRASRSRKLLDTSFKQLIAHKKSPIIFLSEESQLGSDGRVTRVNDANGSDAYLEPGDSFVTSPTLNDAKTAWNMGTSNSDIVGLVTSRGIDVGEVFIVTEWQGGATYPNYSTLMSGITANTGARRIAGFLNTTNMITSSSVANGGLISVNGATPSATGTLTTAKTIIHTAAEDRDAVVPFNQGCHFGYSYPHRSINTRAWIGPISAIMVFPVALTRAERSEVIGWLQNKYSVTETVTPVKTALVPWAGQSDAVGTGRGTPEAGTPRSMAWNTSTQALETAVDPLPHNGLPEADANGAAVPFGKEWVANEVDDLVIVPVAQGGSGFSNGKWTVPTGDVLVEAIRRVEEATANVPNPYIPALYWNQGQSDTATDDYLPLQEALLQYFRDNITLMDDTTPILIPGFADTWRAVSQGRQSMADIVEDTPNRVTYSAYIDTTGLTSNNETVGDGDTVHLSKAAQETVGALAYAAIPTAEANTVAIGRQIGPRFILTPTTTDQGSNVLRVRVPYYPLHVYGTNVLEIALYKADDVSRTNQVEVQRQVAVPEFSGEYLLNVTITPGDNLYYYGAVIATEAAAPAAEQEIINYSNDFILND